MTVREMNLLVVLPLALAGLGKEVSVNGFAPVVVAKTEPLRKPTMRTLSLAGEMPIAVTGWFAVGFGGQLGVGQ